MSCFPQFHQQNTDMLGLIGSSWLSNSISLNPSSSNVELHSPKLSLVPGPVLNSIRPVILQSCMLFSIRSYHLGGPLSSVGIATELRAGQFGIESRWGTRFSATVQTDPGTHPAYCKMDTVSFSGVEAAGA